MDLFEALVNANYGNEIEYLDESLGDNKQATIKSYYTEDFFGDNDKVLCFSIYRNDNPNQEIDYEVTEDDLWRDYSVRPLRFEDSIGSIDNLINDIKFLKEHGFRIDDNTGDDLFKIIGKRVEDI